MAFQTLQYESRGPVGLLRLNRPDKLNAINSEMVDELWVLLKELRADRNLRVLVVTGNGRAFSAGADISRLVDMTDAARVMDFLESIQTLFNAIEDLDRPTVAAINGIAFGGGCELAVACDFRIMAEAAAIGLPEVKIGVLPGAGGTQRITHLLPPAIAKQLVYLGDPLSSSDALKYGLVNKVVAGAEVLDEALRWADKLAALPPLALRSAKLLVHGAGHTDLKTGIEAERQAVAFLFGTEDRREGMRAFLERRSAKFQGR